MSVTEKQQPPTILGQLVLDADVDDHLADLGELEPPLPARLIEHLAQAVRVAPRRVRHVQSDVDGQLQALFGGLAGQRLQRVGQFVAEGEIDRLQLEAARPRSSRSRGCR